MQLFGVRSQHCNIPHACSRAWHEVNKSWPRYKNTRVLSAVLLSARGTTMKINVTIWNEFRHERKNEAVKKIYPDGMHAAIAKGLSASKDFTCRTATLDEPEHGLTESVLKETDVLVWWGHIAHGDVKDEVVKRVQQE